MESVKSTEGRKGKRIVLGRKESSAERPITTPFQMSIAEAFKLFVSVKEAENVKPRTKAEYHVQFGYFQDWLNANYTDLLHAQDISPTIIRSYINYLAYEKVRYEGIDHRVNNDVRGLSPYSVNIRIRFLKAWFNVLVKEQTLIKNPVSGIKLMKVEMDTKQSLSEEEVRLLLQQPNQKSFAQFRDFVMIMLFVDSGMRVQEVCSLDIEDIDFVSRCINLPAVKNKNRKNRIIPLSNEMSRLLQELCTDTQRHFDTNVVFVSNFGERLTTDGIRTNLSKYVKRAGITRSVAPHSFRRFYAKHSALNGIDIFSLQRILGHADITTTRRYIQLNKDDLISQHNHFSPLVNVLQNQRYRNNSSLHNVRVKQ
ncbi:tyrosine recombinase XerD [Paenibacillus sp. CCS19]|uniref:tyrosine-type recombinase/integrase n=1 Tax=Paenibacillus sp. CCS19 TaxID=3158387 RepID=UPI0025636248|nr:tyrosine-type recombinase/integrase [Paenibacillus cellulosilyticus]GMK40902.1 tyrosine recombinase XerD [Paenibacillus cellulosilyticus]